MGVVTGLIAEATCLAHAARRWPRSEPALIYSSGGSPARAATGARQLIQNGATALVSFGLAGGLDPALGKGAVLIPEVVLAPDGARFRADAGWRSRLANCISPTMPCGDGPIAGVETLVASAIAKRHMFETTQAAAVDMESHVVAAAAAEYRLPFIALRAIADPAKRSIPTAARAGLRANGYIDPLGVIGRLLSRPEEVPSVVSLTFDVRAGLRALCRVAVLGGPNLGLCG